MIKVNYSKFFLASCLSVSLSSCALLSGLQTYNLPEEGSYKTDSGTIVTLIPLNQQTLPATRVAEINDKQEYANLFKLHHASYQMAQGDILSIQLWNYPEIAPPTIAISSEQTAQAYGYPIDQMGNIQLPLLGIYKAQGKTLAQINKELRVKYARYLRSPDVIVRVVSYQGKRYSVQGNIQKGGQYYLTDQPISVYAALGVAGGVSETGDNTSISLIRDGKTYNLNTIRLEKSGLSLNKLLIQPNDTLYVNAKINNKIYLMGEAGKNQAITMRDQDMSLSDILGEGLGLDPTSANSKKIYVIRTNSFDKQTAVYHLDLSNIGDFSLANQFTMQKNDIVYVDATGLTRWQRVVNQVIPFSSTVANLQQLGQ